MIYSMDVWIEREGLGRTKREIVGWCARERRRREEERERDKERGRKKMCD